MNKPNETMPSSHFVQPEKAPPMELMLDRNARKYVENYYSEDNYKKAIMDEIKIICPTLKQEEANEAAARIAMNINWRLPGTFQNDSTLQILPVHKYHSYLYKKLEQMFSGESETAANWFLENIQEKDLNDKMSDREYQFEAAFDRFFNPLINYNKLESILHDNNIKKMELSRENKRLPEINLDRHDRERKQEINDELIKLARERKQVEAAQKDAKMLANFVPGYEMNKQEAKKKAEAAGWVFEEDKFVAGWLEKNAVEKAAQLKKKLIEAPKKRKEQFEKRWEKTHPQSAQEKKE